MMLPLTIIMTTYFTSKARVKAASDTLKSWAKHLRYDGAINLHIADDGSELIWTPKWEGVISSSRQERRGLGASLNAGFCHAHEVSPLVFYAVDDWLLEKDLDLTPWAQLLVEREDVGMVRFGPPHPHTHGWIHPLTANWQGWGLLLAKEGYAYAQRPALYHQRFYQTYGPYAEGVSALECERLYCEIVNNTLGPGVVLALPHPWRHIETESLSGVTP